MSESSIKFRMFKLGVKGVDLVKEINNRQFPYAGSRSEGKLKVSAPEMSIALSGAGISKKHRSILQAANKILTEMEKGRIN